MAGQADRPQEILSLPQGGGALSGIGEKFTPDPHTGTANLSHPAAAARRAQRLRAEGQPRLHQRGRQRPVRARLGPGRAGDQPQDLARRPGLRRRDRRVHPVRRRGPGSGRQPGTRRHPIPAPHRGFLRPHRTSQRARQRLLAGAQQGWADQHLRHAGQRRQRPGGDHRPGRCPADLRLEADADHGPVRQPDRVPARARPGPQRRPAHLGSALPVPDPVRGLRRRRATRRSSSMPASAMPRGPTRSPTTGPGSRSAPSAAAHPSRSTPTPGPTCLPAPSPCATPTSSPDSHAPVNGLSLLASVQVTGHDGAATEALPPVTLDYTRFAPGERQFVPVGGGDTPIGVIARLRPRTCRPARTRPARRGPAERRGALLAQHRPGTLGDGTADPRRPGRGPARPARRPVR